MYLPNVMTVCLILFSSTVHLGGRKAHFRLVYHDITAVHLNRFNVLPSLEGDGLIISDLIA